MDGAVVLMGAATIFALGAFAGIRAEEINLRWRERRLAKARRRVNAQLRALSSYYEVNQLIWEARDELRREALRTYDLPLVPAQEDED